MTIEELAKIMAVGNNGGTWSDHYTDDQKNVWRDRARDVLAKMTEKAPIAPADDETVERLECWANDGFSVSPESALALIARIRQAEAEETIARLTRECDAARDKALDEAYDAVDVLQNEDPDDCPFVVQFALEQAKVRITALKRDNP